MLCQALYKISKFQVSRMLTKARKILHNQKLTQFLYTKTKVELILSNRYKSVREGSKQSLNRYVILFLYLLTQYTFP